MYAKSPGLKKKNHYTLLVECINKKALAPSKVRKQAVFSNTQTKQTHSTNSPFYVGCDLTLLICIRPASLSGCRWQPCYFISTLMNTTNGLTNLVDLL